MPTAEAVPAISHAIQLAIAPVFLLTGIAAALIILFHFSSHGWKVDSTGNQQQVQLNK